MRSVLFGLVVLVLLSGCGSSSPMGRAYTDFTAYFNSFYNARNKYEEGVRTQTTQQTAIDRTQFITLFPVPSRTTIRAHDEAIRKSADVLRKHPESRWTDDALLLIGQAYFQQGQFAGAEQKFREVLFEWPVTSGRPSRHDAEARVWLARSMVGNEQFGRAAEFIQESLLRDELPNRQRGALYFVQSDLLVRQQRWSDALASIDAGLEWVRNRELRARALFLKGQILKEQGQFAAAAETFAQASQATRAFELEYAAYVNQALSLAQSNQGAEALALVRRLERDGKNYEARNELRLLRGRVLQFAQEYDAAFDVYDALLYDPEGDVASIRPMVHYHLARLYRDVYGDFILAAAHFDTAATALRNTPAGRARATGTLSPGTAPLSREAIIDADQLREVFASFAQTRARVAELDSVLRIGALEGEAFAGWVLAQRQRLAREQEVQRREAERRMAESAFGGRVDGAPLPGQTQTQGGTATPESGFLGHRDALRVAQARREFEQRWGTRPLAPNWRRQDALRGVESAGETGEDGRPLARARPGVEVTLPPFDVSGIPRTESARTRVRLQRAESRYALANVFFLNLNLPDSAVVWYRKVITEDQDSPLAARAHYALAEVQSALGDSAIARGLWQTALSLEPDPELYLQLLQRLGMEEQNSRVDSVQLARSAFLEARSSLDEDPLTALNALVEVAAAFPQRPEAPQALFLATRAWLHHQDRQGTVNDSLPLPIPHDLAVRAGLLPADSLHLAVTLVGVYDVITQRFGSAPAAQQASRARQWIVEQREQRRQAQEAERVRQEALREEQSDATPQGTP